METKTRAPGAEIIDEVIRVYKQKGSINATALQVEMSATKVRKILITEKMWSSKRSREIGTLFDQGKSAAEIAEALGISRTMVQNYLPYERGLYDTPEKSDTAIRSEKYRERNRTSAQLSEERREQRFEGLELIEGGLLPVSVPSPPTAMHLHLELKGSNLARIEEEYEEGVEEAKILAKYAGVTTSISRDVIVPSSLALHQLHYLINRAFGWQNGHLHDFQLSLPLYEALTAGKLIEIAPIFGYYLKFPNSTFDDEFWDDDYDDSKSIATWLRSKYLKQYKYRGLSDHWIENQAEIIALANNSPILDVWYFWPKAEDLPKKVPFEEATMQDFMHTSSYEYGRGDELLESRRLSEVLSLHPVSIESARKIALQTDKSTIAGYMNLRESYLQQYMLEGEDYNRQKHVHTLAHMLAISQTAEPKEIKPITNKLVYSYDYGDGWQVDITLIQEYGMDAQAIEDEVVARVVETHKSICIAKDGLNVLDDCGNVSGYVDMLRTIHEGEKDEAMDMKEWARSQGWTGRNVQPKFII